MEIYGHNRDAKLKAAGLDAVYVAHYTPYRSRRKYMERSLDRLGIEAFFVTGWDRDAISDADVACMYPSNHYFENEARALKYGLSWLKLGELGLSMKHFAAFYDAVQKGHRNILLLEDDAVFADGFAKELSGLLRDPQVSDYDLLFLGSYFKSKPEELREPPKVMRDGNPKGTVAYLVSSKGARHFMATMPIAGPSDHMVSHFRYPNPPPVRYARRPWLVWQGSRDEGWRQSVRDPVVFKGNEFVLADEQAPCTGCACPGKVNNISGHILAPRLWKSPALTLARRQMAGLDRLNASATQRLDEELMQRMDEDYLAAVIRAGYACTAEGVLQRERVNFAT